MVNKKNNKEISVRAPDYIPKREPVFKDTTGTEALDVFKIAEKIGRFITILMIFVGIFIIASVSYSFINDVNIFLNPMFVGFMGFFGVVNLFCGLLLLAKK